MSPEQKAIIEEYTEKMKDPGLGVKNLHEQGFTGKGVKMAIIDGALGFHNEYKSNIAELHDVNMNDIPGWNVADMHGASVTSIAVGENVGVAPEASVNYYAAVNLSKSPKDIQTYKRNIQNMLNQAKDPNNQLYNEEYAQVLQEELEMIDERGAVPTNKPYVDAINQILDNNEKLPENERVPVISISWGFDDLAPGYDELLKALERAKEQNVFVISTRLDEHYGMNLWGANRNPAKDVNDPQSYEAGAFFKGNAKNWASSFKDSALLVPMDHRTTANFVDGSSYRYEGNDGGMSWAVPWFAGMYTLAKQADSNITPQEFWKLALETSNECHNNDSGEYVGRIINPQKLIDKILKNKKQ